MFKNKNLRVLFLLAGIILLAFILRFYKLAQNPPSLYWDEASLGYNAYSILKTARDEHGKFLPLTNFAAFGDYKPPGYIYAAVPSIAVFGLNEFSVRFPSAFFGVLTVVITYLLTKKIFNKEKIALFAGFFLAISPWHIQFSRGAFEANIGLFLSTLGIYLFFKFAKEGKIYLLFSALFFIAAMYTFTGQRLFVPLILLILAIQFKREIRENLRTVVFIGIIPLVLFWPLFKFATGTIEGELRFNEVAIFKDLDPINQSIVYREGDNFSWWSSIIHNRRLFYLNEYLSGYFDAFSPTFLFAKGDVNPRLSTQEVGELYYFDVILVLAGIYFIFAKKYKYSLFILSWLLVSPMGAATARETPHALRMIHILPTYQILSAVGLYYICKYLNFKRSVILIPSIIVLFLFYYLHMYYVHWPINYSGEWQYGYKETVETTKEYYGQVDNVIVTKSQGRPYIYFLFYMQVDPKEYWQNSKIIRDQFYFYDVDGFGKINFGGSVDETKSNTLYVLDPGQLPSGARKIETIRNLGGKPVFDIGIR